MKTQLRKPARSKGSYTDQYKQEALELWRSSGRSAANFWSTLKYELVYHQRFATYAAARTDIFDYIETLYNRTGLHSSLDYLSPINFESQLN
jgi:transposase InsO family protein